jgi:tetrahydromethanopterin S-methyltransferase subunit F
MYPNISIRDVKSIKAYLFFYDKLYRIVPRGISPDDVAEINQLMRDKKGIITDLPPDRFNEEAYQTFKERMDEWSLVAGIDHLKRWGRTTSIHQDKVYFSLQDWFVNEMGGTRQGDWLQVDERLASIYMLSLANTMATRNSLGLVTDFDSAFTIQEFINYDGKYSGDEYCFDDYRESNNKKLGLMLLSRYLPDNYESIPFSSILNYRDDYKVERRQLLKKMGEFQNNISAIESPEVYVTEIQSYIDDIEEAVTSYRSSLESLNKTVVKGTAAGFGLAGTLVSSLPLLDSIAWMLPRNENILALGVLFGTIWGLQKRSDEEVKIGKQNPHSYLYYLKNQDFPSIKVEKELASLTKELILD